MCRLATAAATVVVIAAATAAAEENEDKDDYPSAAATKTIVVTHINKTSFLSFNTYYATVFFCVTFYFLKKILTFTDFRV